MSQPEKMDCVFCGKVNEAKQAIVFGAPVPDCPFSFNQGKGMICLACYQKQNAAKVA